MGSHLYSLHHHSSKLSRNSKVLFENMISFHRTKATIIGLLEAKRANEWVVTEKLGDALKNKSNAKRAPKKFRFKLGDRDSEAYQHGARNFANMVQANAKNPEKVICHCKCSRN
ncbi:glucomannan 4-beta-mannosyltransferase 1-like [Olea europaea var. sylvestris]|uniref:glucomannan 4-beta-mannosyltransferase 1-like n=1 Tax=Olea europaea var. sylvestris TaxID=158386 RepID=UPI000C1D641B|nr:glucomannan 4-beta-mannosyltransferase 1-like [Olea europaea var. sylvestris]XP_022892507.1 glucomannan 4-beta-mannosyltransferase 1-like [Olea europaea var. sylvestris]XP_022892508.1 glucomannan 4-beta-mannosyltransferase 1-like [Olea europaea var. sylvestris]